MQYRHAVLGGTFDHFHVGHQKLLDTAFAKSQQVTIGIAQPVLYENKLISESIEDYQTRERILATYLKEKDFYSRATIMPITDIYGPTLTNSTIEAIFVTEENLPNVSLINNKRLEKSLTPLQIEVVPFVKDELGVVISSERIRKGEVNRQGMSYPNLFAHKTLLMPETLRSQLQQPLGRLVPGIEEFQKLVTPETMIIAVGDIVALSLRENKMLSSVEVIDFRTRRQKITQKFSTHAVTAYNKQSTINKDAVVMLYKAIVTYLKTHQRQTLIISGEEDLLALPAILLAPLGAVVIYGQYEQGIVVVEVTEETKHKTVEIIRKFE